MSRVACNHFCEGTQELASTLKKGDFALLNVKTQ
jgi:hypothetical protein